MKKPTIAFDPEYLKLLGNPKTVFDIGVGFGTPELYEAYPDARFILVEPLIEFREAIDKLSQDYNMDVHYKAVSEFPSVTTINVDTSLPLRSSINERTPLTRTASEIVPREIEVTTIDTIYSGAADIETPVLLKIDTEGHELRALKGARELLKVTDLVIAEVSVSKRFNDSYSFEEIILFMAEQGFEVYSFLRFIQPKGELRQRFVDVVFRRKELDA